MNRIRDKKRWWAVQCCRTYTPAAPNPMMNVLFPIGMVVLISALFIGVAAMQAAPAAGAGGTVLATTGLSFIDLKKTIDTIGETFEQFKQTNDQRLDAIEKGDKSRATELEQKLTKINNDLTEALKKKTDWEAELKFQRERLEELEAKASTPGKTAAQKVKDEYKELFVGLLRKRFQDAEIERKMAEISRKDVTIGSASGGGYALPEQISRDIELLERKFSPVRDLVKVITVGTSDYKELVDLGGATSGWVGETDARNATNTPTLREVTPTHGEIYAYPQASEWSLDDLFFNVENWLTEAAAEAFAIAEATAVLTGNGANKPTGMLNTTPTTVDDSPVSRAAAVYQYISSSASPLAIDPDKLIDLVYKLNSKYRAGATWVMNSTTTGFVRKIKDDNDVYIWQPGLQQGQPDRLLGYPVSTWEQMADVAANAFPIAFGNFKRGYLLVDRVGTRITRDNVTNIGYVRFYIRRREGGIVLNNDAIKWIRT